VKAAILPLALLAASCAPRLLMTNELGGTINQQGSMGNDRAFAMAEAHCAKYGKSARIVNKTVLVKSMRFECVAK
jgi:hypothetical protein